MQQIKDNFEKIKASVELEYQRLNHLNASLWAKNKANELVFALSRMERIIAEIENNVTQTVRPTLMNGLFPALYLDDGDLDKQQCNKESLSSIDKMLDLKVNIWVGEKTITYYDAADNEKEKTIPAHWSSHLSIRETLGIGRFNIFTTLCMANYGTLWGKSTALSNVERMLFSDQPEEINDNKVRSLVR